MIKSMKAVYSEAYIDELVDSRSYDAMAMLSTYVEAASPASDEAGRGLPIQLFVFIEAFAWFAQAARSGVWTYFEATTPLRQEAMRASLLQLRCDSLAQLYSFGMLHWKGATLMQKLDRALDEAEKDNESWLVSLLDSQRGQLRQLLCQKGKWKSD